MKGLSEREYAAHVGLSRGAIQKAKGAARLVLHADGSIDAAASDWIRGQTTDPSKTRDVPAPKLRPVPEAAMSAVGDTLREQGLAAPATDGSPTFLQAKTAHEVLKAQERRIRLARLKGALIDRARATALVFRLAREERDAWVTCRLPDFRNSRFTTTHSFGRSATPKKRIRVMAAPATIRIGSGLTFGSKRCSRTAVKRARNIVD